jgi:LPS sulfotransferase NodH
MTSDLLKDLRGYAGRVVAKIRLGRRHPYQDQFSPRMDCETVDHADRFLMIASTPRCGSHYLGHMLGATGQCGVPLEYFHPANLKVWARRFGTDDIQALFPKIVQHRTSQNGAFMVKAHWDQFKPISDRVAGLTQGAGFDKTIWISRRNQLSQAISYVIAAQSGVWISGAKPTGETHFDYDAIVESAKATRADNLEWRAYMETLGPDRGLAVVFEDLLGDSAAHERIAEFLSLETALHPSERTQKQGDGRNADWKARFNDQLRDEDTWILETPVWLAAPAA